ncbi:GNAT family N-acetyltransferase [Propioniferax innocua]|uniref:RimJ/RimL family protein N-acetyltransferase n=1 Tax=Propioniferax innocua TaxID=1753 RepID=A0A542ZBT3_9ACTN|nr:GNAT family N-acetyltransferase [Propioniferax innocua]TQL57804.1 RimJ/RimL family protein N-acetyltransferase [Propioniferax innocua]
MLDATLLPLRDDQARLRPMHDGDAAKYAIGTKDVAVRTHAHLPEPDYTEESVSSLIHGPIQEGLERGDLAVLSVADARSDEFVGSLVLFGAIETSIEVGFWVHPDHRGQGFAAAALLLAIEFVRRSGFTRLTARTVPENIASQRSLERAGFRRGEETHGTAPSGEQTLLTHYARPVAPLGAFPRETERLRLRLHEHRDVGPLQRIYGRHDVARYLLEDPWSMADAEQQVARRMLRTGLDDGRTALALVIEHHDEVIGDVALWLTDPDRSVAEIGWVMDPDQGGRGLATEAVRTVLDMAFHDFELHRVVAQMDARNKASARLAERVGMTKEAHMRQDWWNKGEWTDTLVFGVLASDTDRRIAYSVDDAPRLKRPDPTQPHPS